MRSTGTLAVSWGPYGGFYIVRHRICLGWLALTHTRPEIDDLMEAYVERDAMRDALGSIRVYSEAGQDGTHKSWGEACGEDACLVCLIEGTAAEALGKDQTRPIATEARRYGRASTSGSSFAKDPDCT